MTTGEAGMRSQARGLARTVGGEFNELVIGLRKPWSLFPGALTPIPWRGLAADRNIPSPPWPDVLITCGRRSTAVSIAIRRASGGRTLTAHIGHPRTSVAAFDLIFPMAHDGLAGPNVTPLPTSLHDVTPFRLARAAAEWRGVFGDLPRPLLGVLVGGSTRKRPFTDEHARSLLNCLAAFQRRTGGGLAVAFSRRTPASVRTMIAETCGRWRGVVAWTADGASPYLGILARADSLLVTSDSVSMISEALATTLPIDVFDLRLGGRLERFLRSLTAAGLVRRCDAVGVAPARLRPTNTTAEAAGLVHRALRARGWVDWSRANAGSSTPAASDLDLEQSPLTGNR